MSEKESFEPQFPTEEELNALLSEVSSEGSELDSDSTLFRRALIVSQNDATLKSLTDVLSQLKIEISMARNPYTGLDYLRARDFNWVFTDFSLWAAGGKLLFDRIHELDFPVEVIFLCEQDSDQIERARLTTARASLDLPLKEEGLKAFLSELLKERQAQSENSTPVNPDVSDLSESDSEIHMLLTDSNEAVQLESLPQPDSPSENETFILWYKVFFLVRKNLRELSSLQSRLKMFAECLMEFEHLEQIALVLRRPSEEDNTSHLELVSSLVDESHFSGFGNSASVDANLLKSLSQISQDFFSLKEDEEPQIEAEFLESHWIHSFTLHDSTRVLFLGIPQPHQSLRAIPDSVRTELPYLIREMVEEISPSS